MCDYRTRAEKLIARNNELAAEVDSLRARMARFVAGIEGALDNHDEAWRETVKGAGPCDCMACEILLHALAGKEENTSSCPRCTPDKRTLCATCEAEVAQLTKEYGGL